MAFETLEDQCLVADCFFLQDFDEVLIDLSVVDCPERSYLFLFSFCLNVHMITSSPAPSPFRSSLRSTSSLSNRLSFLSLASIMIQNILFINSSKTEHRSNYLKEPQRTACIPINNDNKRERRGSDEINCSESKEKSKNNLLGI